MRTRDIQPSTRKENLQKKIVPVYLFIHLFIYLTTDTATSSKRGLLAGLIKKKKTNKQAKLNSELVTVS